MSPLNSTEHGDPHRARTKLGSFAIGLVHGMGGSAGVGILLVASIESQLLGVISLGALAIFTGRSMTILSRAFGAALASRPHGSSLTAWRLVSESRASRSRCGTELPPGPSPPIRSERSSCTAREALEPVRHAHDLPEDHAVLLRRPSGGESAMSHLASEATSELEKRTAAATAAALVESGMTLGLGTGSTVAYLLPILASRRLRLRCVATSVATERAARRAGLRVEPFDALDELDLAVDGADQVHRSGWLVKGGGGAHTREKIVAAAARRFIVIASSDKLVDELRPPVPLELLAYGVPSTLRTLGPTRLRGLVSPDGGLIADYTGPIGDPGLLASRFAGIPGLVEHGMFAPELVTEIFVARGRDVERIEGRRR